LKNSYSLSNDGTNWIAEGALESGRKFRIVCAPATSPREAAEAVADLKLAQRLQQSAASKTRWAKHEAAAAAANPPAPATPAAAEKHAAIRARLLSVGDSKSDPDVDVDDDAGDDDAGDATVHPSLDDAKAADAGGEDDDEEHGEDDDEAAEVLADVIGNGIFNGLIVGGTTKLMKRAKPPKRPGEPHELFVRYGREGCCYRIRKLIGKDAKLGPNGKLAIGLAGTIAMMLWNAEEIVDEAAAAAPARPNAPPAPAPAKAAAAAAAAAAPAADQKPRTELRLVRPPAAPPAPAPGSARPTTPPEDDNPIGRFR